MGHPPAVRGAAHYDLSHSALDHTVSAVLLVWDATGGTVDADFDGSLARALGSPLTRRVAPAALAAPAAPAALAALAALAAPAAPAAPDLLTGGGSG